MCKSVYNIIWHKNNPDKNLQKEISLQLNTTNILAQLLSSRVKTVDEAYFFLEGKIKNNFSDPFHLKDMKIAVKRFLQALQKKEKICIFGDYDVDGATSSALLKGFFRDIGIECDIYIPDRIKEGYGPNIEAIGHIKKRGVSLIITVDCGSVSFEPLEYAKKENIDVIVIDHHISLDSLPEAIAVINPNRLDQESEYKNLAAVGVSFIFAAAIIMQMKEKNLFEKYNLQKPDLRKYLDLVALGTICDVVELNGLNRAFVKQGLKITQQRKNKGYKALCDVANIDSKLDVYHLGFIIGPRINAGGRVGKSYLGAQLLSTLSDSEANRLSKDLNHYNEERKIIEMKILEEAILLAEKQSDRFSLFIVGYGWHPGVIGIIAGRLKEKYNKPVSVLSVIDSVGKASCRSVRGVDFGSKILEAKHQELLIAGGGHSMAAGFTVAENNIDKLDSFLESQFKKDLSKSDSHLIEYYDIDLISDGLTYNLLKEIQKLEPFGNGNPRPVIRVNDLLIIQYRIIQSKHMNFVLRPFSDTYGKKNIYAIMFNCMNSNFSSLITSNKLKKISILCTISTKMWEGQERMQVTIKDVII